ncbi:hypothetical protein D3C73_1220080 [compost metagenome]
MGGEQHIHFVFEAFAGNLAQPVQHLGGEAAQTGLGIINFGACSQGKDNTCHRVAEAAAQGNGPAEAAAAQDDSGSDLVLEHLGNPLNVMGQMLAVTIRTDHIAWQPGLVDVPEPCFEGEPFSEIDRMGQNRAAECFCNVEDPPVSRAAAVIYKDNRPKLVIAELFN